MVKAKKSKKDTIKNEEVDSEGDVKTTNIGSDSDSEVGTIPKNKKSKDKKKSGIRKEAQEMSGGDCDVEVLTKNIKKNNVNAKTKAKKKNKVSDDEYDSDDVNKLQKGGFALLNIDSDEDVNEEKQISDGEIEVRPKKGKPKTHDSLEDDAKPKEPVGGKKSKKSKKKRNDTDEDLDQVLAELTLEYAGVKKEPESVTSEPTRKNDKTSKKFENQLKYATFEKEDEQATSGAMKTAAQKKKEKKERQKRDAGLARQEAAAKNEKFGSKAKKEEEREKSEIKETVETEEIEKPEEIVEPELSEAASGELQDEEDGSKGKDDKKKKKKDKPKPEEKKKEEEKTRKGPGKAAVAAMQETLRKMKEEEERLKREEEESIRIAEEVETMRLDQLRLEQERKDKKKQKEKERKDRLKAEGKLLTTKQKFDKARAQAMLDSFKAQGLDLPDVNEKRARPGTRLRSNKKIQTQDQTVRDPSFIDQKIVEPSEDSETKEQNEIELIEEVVPDVKEAWDVSSSSGEEAEDEKSVESKPLTALTTSKITSNIAGSTKNLAKHQKSAEKIETETSSDDSDDESDESEVEMNEQQKVDAEMRKQRVRVRIAKRRSDSELKQTTDNLRAAVVCVLGHVDTGKTKILDKLRRTNVQDGEAGGITQQIGATNVPIEAIKEQTKIVKGFAEMNFKLPGLLIIDTPGHESFSNLRNRGSSLCDIAILVVDIMHGLEPQTIESLNLLKSRKTPFVVALNKIDRLYDWQTMVRKDVRDGIKGQQSNTHLEFTQRTKEVVLQFAEQGLNAALFYENPDPRTYVSMVPTSAITGEGMGNLLFLIIESCQTLLVKRLMYSEDLLATVLEVKAIPGLGTTIDAILINGKLREGETMIIAGTDGPIVTQIRSLLMPQPMKELRVKNAYVEYKEIKAAQGVKIAAKDLEKAIAGLNLQVAQKPDEVEIFR